MPRTPRLQFTLTDLIAAVTVIGLAIPLVMALLPGTRPAIQTMHASNCLNNMTQVGKALLAYERRQGHFPGYKNIQAERSFEIGADGTLAANAPLPNPYPQSTGWAVPLLLYLDRADLDAAYGPSAPDQPQSRRGCPLDFHFPIFICPADQVARAEPAAASSYVVNAGMEDLHGPRMWDQVAGDATTSPDEPANGVFHYDYPYTANVNARSAHSGLPVKRVRLKLSDLMSGDGTSSTILVTENVDGGLWTDDREYQVGVVWEPVTAAGERNSEAKTAVLRINEDVGGSRTAAAGTNPYRFARPSSYHAGGVNVFFADGHGRFLVDSIDPLVYAQLMSVDGAGAAWPRPPGIPRQKLSATAGQSQDYSAYTKQPDPNSY